MYWTCLYWMALAGKDVKPLNKYRAAHEVNLRLDFAKWLVLYLWFLRENESRKGQYEAVFHSDRPKPLVSVLQQSLSLHLKFVKCTSVIPLLPELFQGFSR